MSCPNYKIEMPIVHGKLDLTPLLPIDVTYSEDAAFLIDVKNGVLSEIATTEPLGTTYPITSMLQFTKSLSVYMASKFRNKAVDYETVTDDEEYNFYIREHNVPGVDAEPLLTLVINPNETFVVKINTKSYSVVLMDMSNMDKVRPYIPADYGLVIKGGKHESIVDLL